MEENKNVSFVERLKAKLKAVSRILMCSFLSVLFAVAAFAAEGDDLATGISSIKSALSGFSSTNIVTVLVAAVGVALPLILIWFAFRKIFSWAKAAFYGG